MMAEWYPTASGQSQHFCTRAGGTRGSAPLLLSLYASMSTSGVREGGRERDPKEGSTVQCPQSSSSSSSSSPHYSA